MTLSPSDDRQVRGLDGPSYKVGPDCSNPGCGRFAEHVHHIWRRSAIGGAYGWVAVRDENGYEHTVGNLTGLCPDCHDDITGRLGGHRARIIYRAHQFFWAVLDSHEQHEGIVGLISPQPPTPESISRAHGHSPEGSEEPCPFCGQARRRSSATSRSVGGRRRKSWVVKVPDDAENGAEILDTLVEDLGLTLGKDPATSGRYYILLPALYHAVQSKAALVESLKGVGA